MEDDILTIEEVAKYLRVSDRTVYDWAQKGEIPAGKIGTVWRFKKTEVENWVNARLSSDSTKQSEQAIQVRNILSPDRIVFISQTSKHDALVELADVLATAPQVKDGAELTQEILKREELMSTAIGRGIAIPHGKTDTVADLVACIGISDNPVDFDSLDQEPCRIFIMTLSPINKTGPHLQFLAEVSLLFKSAEKRAQILNTQDKAEVIRILTE